ncbi:MAG: TonB-dependent receptor [Bacteroidales bacterium]|nr:TonB-dependent receptor [Bacteroidales bacterium]
MKRVITALLLSVANLGFFYAQFVFSGKVHTEKQEPLPGAIVEIPAIKRYAVADANGNFSFSNLPAGNYTISVRFIGYNTISDEIAVQGNTEKNYTLSESVTAFDEVIVSAVRAHAKTPTTFAIVPRKEITRVALGQDVPFLLSHTPSVVTTSDAGNGIGYTSMRIRGIEPSKTNVTINGIPLNDPESHGVYWVDVPDIATSVQSIQIQRGIGTSTNGAGAFGATINLLTNNVSQKPYYEYNGAVGSFATLKNSIAFGTGLINAHWFLEGKVTGIKSDGYIDRGWSNLKSYFAQTGYYSDRTIVKLIGFGGREETYQAWYGIDSATLFNPQYGRKFNWTGAYTDSAGNIRFFDKMIDHYEQDHLQFHVAHAFSDNLNFNVALHYTYGRGYYQDFVPADPYMPLDYFGLPLAIKGNDTIRYTDVIQRLWLDNHFYGCVWGLNYFADRLSVTFGGGANRYAPAKHFGQVIWARYFLDDITGKKFYENEGEKNDMNSYLKVNFQIVPKLMAFGDLQYRYIDYRAWGTNREYADGVINIDKQYNFINPKIGFLFEYTPNLRFYASYAVANREPTRSDFVDAAQGEEPRPERLYDLESGVRYTSDKIMVEAVFYDMQYRDQLILTGEVNSVGTPIRRNVGKSYRRGIELVGKIQPHRMFTFEGNATLSRNKTEYAVFKDSILVKYNNNDIAYSPSLIAGLSVRFKPTEFYETGLMFKHVGKQYFDNTQDPNRRLDAYSLVDWIHTFSYKWAGVGEFQLTFKINNLFDNEYIAHARVSSSGTKYYYPQAGRNYLVGLSIKF